MIAAVFLAVFSFIGLPKKANLAITTILLVFYSFIAGSNTPILRAVIMFAVCSVGYLIDRDTDILNSLSIAALAILLFNPKELCDPSFQLSFVSVASIVIFAPKLEALFAYIMPEDKLPRKPKAAYRYISGSVSVSIAAWLGSFPVIASYFNIISPVSVIANLIVIPVLFLMMVASFLFLVASLISSYAAIGFGLGLQIIGKALFSINAFLAKIPFAYFRIGRPAFGFTFLYYSLIALLILPADIKLGWFTIKRRRVAVAILILFNVLIWRAVLYSKPVDAKMVVLDVGQGDSIFMEFPQGGTMLIDGGPGGIEDRVDMGKSVVAPFLWNKGVGTIDLLVATHFHDDHLGGLLYVLKNFNVGCIIDNGMIPDGGKIYEEYARLIETKKIRRISVGSGDLIKAFKDTGIFVLNPEEDKRMPDSNDNSIVLKIVYKDVSLMLCADIKDKAISRLIAYGDFLKSDVMKVPHHGGDLGNPEVVGYFFSEVSPEISLISVGAANKYGMPSGKTMGLLTSLGVKNYMTKYDGAIEIFIDHKTGRIRIGKYDKI